MISSYLLATGGHPKASYLGFLGAAALSLFVPFVLPAFREEIRLPWPERITYWLSLFVLVSAGILLAAPYVSQFYLEFMGDNSTRVGNDYQWALASGDTRGGALRNLFDPLGSDVHGSFGGSSLIIMPLFLPVLLALCIRVPRSMLTLVGLSALLFLVSIGDATPVHYLFWKYFPLADSFRTPGRVSLTLLFPLFLMLAWLFLHAETSPTWRERTLTGPLSPPGMAALLSLALLLTCNFALDGLVPGPAFYFPKNINNHP